MSDVSNITAEPPPTKSKISDGWKYADGLDKLMIFVGLFAALALGVTLPLNMVVMGEGIGDVGSGKDMFHKMVVNFCILAAVASACGFISCYCLELSAERQVARIQKLYVRAVQRQEVGFFDVKDVGTLSSDIESSCVLLRNGIGNKTSLAVRAFAQFIGGYAVGLTKGWKMALVLSSLTPAIVISFSILMIRIQKASQTSKERFEKAGSVAEESLGAIRTISAFGMEEKFSDKFRKHIDGVCRTDVSSGNTKAFVVGIVMMTIFGSYALGWWYGGRLVRDRLLDTDGADLSYGGKVLTVFFSVMIASFSLSQVSPSMTALAAASKAIQSIEEIIERHSLIDPADESGQKESPLTQGSARGLLGRIEFRNVRFSYPSRPDRQVYDDVSFTIEPGETVALVGPSGSGKSTVIQLLERFYDPTDGEILIDGLPHRDYNLQWLRSNMALVSQEPRLFCDTIRANIAYGWSPDEGIAPAGSTPMGGKRVKASGGPDISAIEEAARLANAHNFISQMSGGYDTHVGQGGSLLSGGQKQRVAIARAILRDPSILILDEATSALDNQSEKIVQEALDKLIQSKKRTTIIIAHRLTTIRNASKIIVIDNDGNPNGSIVREIGTHEELMAIPNGTYKALVLSQSVGNPDDPENNQANKEFLDARRNKIISRMSKEYLGQHRYPSKTPSKSLSKNLSKNDSFRQLHSVSSKHFRKLDSIEEEVWRPKRVFKGYKANLIRYMRPQWIVMIAGLCCCAGVGTAFPFVAWLISDFLDVFFAYDPRLPVAYNADHLADESNKLALKFVYLCIAVGFLACVQSACLDYAGARLVARLRKVAFRNILYQDMEFFDAPQHNVGWLSSILSADCETARGAVGPGVGIQIQNIVSLIVAIVIAFMAEARLAAVTACLYFLIIPATWLQARLTQTTSDAATAITDGQSPAFHLNEIVTNLKTVASYGLQDQMSAKYEAAVDRKLKKGRANALICGVATLLADAVPYFAMGLAYWYAGKLMRRGELDLKHMMRVTIAIMMAGNGVARSAEWTTDSKKAKAATENILFVAERVPKMDARSDDGSTQAIRGDIKVQNVKFRYPGRPDAPILQSVSFDIKPGETVALVGESGSGKSTIIQFLERFYDIGASDHLRILVAEHNKVAEAEDLKRLDSASNMFGGEILVEGRNIQGYNLRHLRRQFGLVGQEPVLFDESVRENILAGNPDATDEEIVAACRAANAHEFVSQLPEGYDTVVGKGGGLLSGGQKQRVAIARAIVRDPKVLLLDEATSALDPESEEIVQRALDDLMEKSKRTTIVIAHRLSTIRRANKIVVFEAHPGEGSTIAEVGTHEELMNIPDGIYKNLVQIATSAQR